MQLCMLLLNLIDIKTRLSLKTLQTAIFHHAKNIRLSLYLFIHWSFNYQ